MFGNQTIGYSSKCVSEIEALDDRKLMLPMLIAKAKMMDLPTDCGNHTDDQLLAIAKQHKWPILTVDTELKRRLSQSNIPWIEVSGRSHLRQVG